jgi:hypothetical protein
MQQASPAVAHASSYILVDNFWSLKKPNDPRDKPAGFERIFSVSSVERYSLIAWMKYTNAAPFPLDS